MRTENIKIPEIFRGTKCNWDHDRKNFTAEHVKRTAFQVFMSHLSIFLIKFGPYTLLKHV